MQLKLCNRVFHAYTEVDFSFSCPNVGIPLFFHDAWVLMSISFMVCGKIWCGIFGLNRCQEFHKKHWCYPQIAHTLKKDLWSCIFEVEPCDQYNLPDPLPKIFANDIDHYPCYECLIQYFLHSMIRFFAFCSKNTVVAGTEIADSVLYSTSQTTKTNIVTSLVTN